jgi:Ser-tRNA(Ala) deacylase AlaX
MTQIPPTIRLYMQNDHCFETSATTFAIRENRIAFDPTCFYPGGGGQPPDTDMLKSI